MQAAGWSTSSTFAKFQDKNIETVNFGSVILNTTKDAQQRHKQHVNKRLNTLLLALVVNYYLHEQSTYFADAGL